MNRCGGQFPGHAFILNGKGLVVAKQVKPRNGLKLLERQRDLAQCRVDARVAPGPFPGAEFTRVAADAYDVCHDGQPVVAVEELEYPRGLFEPPTAISPSQ